MASAAFWGASPFFLPPWARVRGTAQLQRQLRYTTPHPTAAGEVTTATTPKNTTPTTFRSISGFALPSMHHSNSPLLQCPIFEIFAAALRGTAGIWTCVWPLCSRDSWWFSGRSLWSSALKCSVLTAGQWKACTAYTCSPHCSSQVDALTHTDAKVQLAQVLDRDGQRSRWLWKHRSFAGFGLRLSEPLAMSQREQCFRLCQSRTRLTP